MGESGFWTDKYAQYWTFAHRVSPGVTTKVHDLAHASQVVDKGHPGARQVCDRCFREQRVPFWCFQHYQQGISGVERHVTAGWCTTTMVVLARTVVAPLEMYSTPPDAPTDAKLSCIGQPSALPMLVHKRVERFSRVVESLQRQTPLERRSRKGSAVQ